MSTSLSVPITSLNTPIHKKDVSHLKPYQWKPGQSGKTKGVKHKATRMLEKYTQDIVEQALLTDPKTGKKFKTRDEAAVYLARRGDSDGRIYNNLLDRHWGKVADKVDSQITFILAGSPTQDALTHTVTDDKLTIEVPALPPGGDSNDNSDS